MALLAQNVTFISIDLGGRVQHTRPTLRATIKAVMALLMDVSARFPAPSPPTGFPSR